MTTSTTDFYDTIRERSESDADFRISLLENAAESIISGDLEECKAALRLYIKTSIGYKQLADLTGIHPKSLVRMLGPRWQPPIIKPHALASENPPTRRHSIRSQSNTPNRKPNPSCNNHIAPQQHPHYINPSAKTR